MKTLTRLMVLIVVSFQILGCTVNLAPFSKFEGMEIDKSEQDRYNVGYNKEKDIK